MNHTGGVSFYPPSRPRAVQGGLTARSARGRIGETWWSKRFIGVLEGFALGSRLTRGRSYARRGQVVSLQVAPGAVTARVQGSRATPYKVALGLAPFSSSVWAEVDAALAAQAIHAAALLAGQMPPGLEEVFDSVGAQLFPRSVRDLRMSCSCPDREVPCKHIAASFYLLAERFDVDPFEILHWRGRPREVLLARVRELRCRPGGEEACDAGPDPGPGPESKPGARKRTTKKRTPPGGASPKTPMQLATGRGVAPDRAGADSVIGTAIALADLPDAEPVAPSFWTAAVPLPPLAPVLDTPPDLLLRQLPEPSSVLGGAELVDLLHALYAALPDPDPDPDSGADSGVAPGAAPGVARSRVRRG